MKIIIQLALILVLLSGCGTPPVAITPTSVDVRAIQTAAVQTAIAGIATATPIKPTETLVPTTTPEPVSGKMFSWNYLSEQESGGIKIQIARVVIADKLALLPDRDFSKIQIFDDKPLVVEIIFKVSNSTDNEITVFTNQGTVIVGSEQVNLIDYAMAGTQFGEKFSGKIFPGVTVIGGIWFGLKRIQLDDIQNMVIAIDAPINESNYASLGPDFRIAVDLSQRGNEPIPDELK